MRAEASALPVTVEPLPGEALDGYLERLAAYNSLDNAALTRRLRARGDPTSFVTIRPAPGLRHQIEALTGLGDINLEAATLQGLTGINLDGLDAGNRYTWRTVAARGWAPARGTAICPACLRQDGIWRIAWRHPWITTCLDHQSWLLATCPRCGLRFRSQRTPLLTVDTTPGTCGNPAVRRGSSCQQGLDELQADSAPTMLLATHERIWDAVHGTETLLLGTRVPAGDYLTEIKALTVLLLHLATRPGGKQLASWAQDARLDHDRSAGGRGARWGLAPPADLQLRGQAIAAADAVLRQRDLETAADTLHPWTELSPSTNDGQLGWLADHTTMTPRLTRLVMAATAQRRRLSALLADQTPIEARFVSQAVPDDLYARHIDEMLAVTATTGRLFASLCLVKLGRPGCTWADAAAFLGIDPAAGIDAVRACTGQIVCGPRAFVDHLRDAAAALAEVGVDYRAREDSVRRLVNRRRWYQTWTSRHRPGALPGSRRYAITYLWIAYAASTPRLSPVWRGRPTATEMAYYRRYAASINANPDARTALLALVASDAEGGPDREATL